MSDWDAVLDEAGWLAQQFRQREVDLAEAEGVGDYYVSIGCDDKAMARYLDLMAKQPPPRSRRSQSHFKNLWAIWQTWRPKLAGRDKARAWGWGVREAKAAKKGR